MQSNPPRVCVMGHPVAHSRSPMIHGYWLETLRIAGVYELRDVTPEAFPDFFTHLADHGYVGGNITAPNKEAAYRLVDRRDETAEAIGAVNTVWFESGRLQGANSDVHGFMAHLDDAAPGWDASRGLAVVLGAGGAARSAVYALVRRGVPVAVVNRTLERAQVLAAHIGSGVRAYTDEALPRLLPEAALLANCTAGGMTGKAALDVDLATLPPDAVVYDIVYVPLETPLLRAARAAGHRTVDGLGMLLHQAGLGFSKWFGVMPQVTPELRARVEADLLGQPR